MREICVTVQYLCAPLYDILSALLYYIICYHMLLFSYYILLYVLIVCVRAISLQIIYI